MDYKQAALSRDVEINLSNKVENITSTLREEIGLAMKQMIQRCLIWRKRADSCNSQALFPDLSLGHKSASAAHFQQLGQNQARKRLRVHPQSTPSAWLATEDEDPRSAIFLSAACLQTSRGVGAWLNTAGIITGDPASFEVKSKT